MDSSDDLTCPVCLELCRNAVETKCCSHAFCEECVILIKNKKDECPCCKDSPLTFRNSKIIRRLISTIPVTCPHQDCMKKLENGNLPTHIKYCASGTTICSLCDTKMTTANIVAHLAAQHPEEALKVTVDYNHSLKLKVSNISSNLGSQSNIFGSSNAAMDPAVKVINRIGREASLGVSAKYYCGGPLVVKCNCCNGSCGPTNGENCLACMELDVKLRNLPKGSLVNSGGVMARVDYEERLAYCGVHLPGIISAKRCLKGSPCQLCSNLMKSMQRYKTLLID